MTVKELYDKAIHDGRENLEIIVEYCDDDYIVSHAVESEEIYSDDRAIFIDLT